MIKSCEINKWLINQIKLYVTKLFDDNLVTVFKNKVTLSSTNKLITGYAD